MHRPPRHHRPPAPRRGVAALLVVGALLVVLGATALCVDRLWLDNASVELQASADAAALAAARTLANDDTLLEDSDWQPIVERAMDEAQRASDLNPVAGGKLKLRPGPEGDVWFGLNVLDRETGQRQFVHTDWQPSVVVVRAERTRDTSNPVGLLMGGLFGVHFANVSTYAEVTVDNHVLGIRAHRDYPVPALPIALLATGEGRIDSWAGAIDARGGEDRLGWDAVKKQVTVGSDGLPEIVVRPSSSSGGTDENDVAPSVQLLDFASGFRFGPLGEQFDRGLTVDDLADFDEAEMLLDGRSHTMDGSAAIDRSVLEMFTAVIGRPRLCFLYEGYESTGSTGGGTLDVTRLVAVRVLAVRSTANGPEIVLQPAVVTTKTAVPFEDWQWSENDDAYRNPYVYKLNVTK